MTVDIFFRGAKRTNWLLHEDRARIGRSMTSNFNWIDGEERVL